jgi:hypothetical protein
MFQIICMHFLLTVNQHTMRTPVMYFYTQKIFKGLIPAYCKLRKHLYNPLEIEVFLQIHINRGLIRIAF